MTHHLDKGTWGEKLATGILENFGYQILERNWRPRPMTQRPKFTGEIDIVASDWKNNLIFIEVKTRSNQNYGHPLESINSHKASKLKHLAYSWVEEHPHHHYRSLQIDAVAIIGNAHSFRWEHVEAVC